MAHFPSSIPVTAVQPQSLTHEQAQAAMGALIGAAVGDALGAPFEFKPADMYAKRFPTPVLDGMAEMIGGGAFNWEPGEFTDDTQMAMALAEALLAFGGEFDKNTVWDHFVAWSDEATDIGNTTRRALNAANPDVAAETAHVALNGRTGSNGSVMRIAPIGIAGVRWGQEKTMRIAREQSAITHFDPVAGWAAAIAAEVIRACILGARFDKAVHNALLQVDDEYRDTFNTHLSENWTPDQTTISNGGAVVCLAQAVWAVRTTTSFEDAVTAAVNLGDDADTVAAVTGALAGAVYGMQRIPARWSTYVHGTVNQPDGKGPIRYSLNDMQNIARRLIGKRVKTTANDEHLVPPTKIHEMGIYATNYLGAPLADTNMGIVSLCRMEDALRHHPNRREFYIIDQWGEQHNPHLRHVTEEAVDAIDAFLAEGREVVVHCHGGRSRTGFILKAWYMRTFGVKHAEAHTWLKANWPLYVTWNDDFEGFIKHEWMQEAR